MENIDNRFNEDYRFFVKWREDRRHLVQRNYLEDNIRFQKIISTWEDYESTKGKFSWLVAESYFSLEKACYRIGIIKNYEEYLRKEPFEEEIKTTLIPAFGHSIRKIPMTPKDFEIARKVHYQMVYYVLAKTYEKENEIENAFRCVNSGIAIYPSEKFLFYFEMFEIYRKANRLNDFLKECNKLPKQEQQELDGAISRAKMLLKNNYIFKPRKKEIK